MQNNNNQERQKNQGLRTFRNESFSHYNRSKTLMSWRSCWSHKYIDSDRRNNKYQLHSTGECGHGSLGKKTFTEVPYWLDLLGIHPLRSQRKTFRGSFHTYNIWENHPRWNQELSASRCLAGGTQLWSCWLLGTASCHTTRARCYKSGTLDRSWVLEKLHILQIHGEKSTPEPGTDIPSSSSVT